MNAVNVLPEGYEEFYSLDLQKDKQKALLVNGIALAIGVLMAVPMHFAVPITTLILQVQQEIFLSQLNFLNFPMTS